MHDVGKGCTKKSPHTAVEFDLPPSLEKNAVPFSKTNGLTHNALQKKTLPSIYGGYGFFGTALSTALVTMQRSVSEFISTVERSPCN